MSNGTYALRVSFENAQKVAPSSIYGAAASSADSKAAPLSRVSYTGLWKGIGVTYDAPAAALGAAPRRWSPASTLRRSVPPMRHAAVNESLARSTSCWWLARVREGRKSAYQ